MPRCSTPRPVVVCHADEAGLQAMVEALLDRVRRAKTAFVYPL